jgi:hypothetical protein
MPEHDPIGWHSHKTIQEGLETTFTISLDWGGNVIDHLEINKRKMVLESALPYIVITRLTEKCTFHFLKSQQI